MMLARHRCEELDRLKIEDERVGLIVNRWHRSDPSTEEIGSLVRREVTTVFPNDYPVVRSAIVSGRPVSERSRLGQAFTEFAEDLLGKQTVKSNSIAGKLKSFWGKRETTHAG
jgi:Flp pilus assembly CpaE family ATPase